MNLNQLDNLEYDGSSEMLTELEAYIDEIVEHFIASEEGIEYAKHDPDLGFWAAKLVDYGFTYEGVSLPQMETFDVEELLTDVFPRKISLGSADEANAVIPELLAFWHFIKREYNLKNADSILRYLQQIEGDYYAIMNDSSRFGMAKSFMTLGQNSGFDMSDGNDVNAFMQTYNQSILGNKMMNKELPFDEVDGMGRTDIGSDAKAATSKKEQAKKKKIRKMKKASRKKNKKKR